MLAYGTAEAQDLIAKPALPPAEESSWSGLHLGIDVGARISQSVWATDCLAPTAFPATCPNDIFGGATRIGNDNPVSFDTVAARLGGYIGIDWQIGRLVLGVEGDAAWSNDEGDHAGIPGAWSDAFGPGINAARIESAWDASLRGRVGFLFTPRLLIYSTAGLAVLEQEISATCEGTFPLGWCVAPNADSQSAISIGWTAGGGVERMLAPGWIVRGEYRYSDYGSEAFTLFEDRPLDSVGVTVSRRASLAYLGLSRHF